MSLRSALGAARGLGSAGHGVSHWWWQRLTGVALIPLSVWFVFSFVSRIGAGADALASWASSPVTATLLTVFLVAMFHHAQLGLQVIVEDYVHREIVKLALLVGTKFVMTIAATAAVLSVLLIAVRG